MASSNIGSVIGNILAKNQNVQVNEGDYYDEDGLLHCGVCHAKKQTRIELFGKVMTPRCICKCEEAKLQAEEEARKAQERKYAIQRMRKAGFADEEMQKWTFANDDRANEKISTIAENYVKNFEEIRKLDSQRGLLLYGTVGTGKTFISACIANALIDKGYPCMVTNFARLTNTIGGMYEGKQSYLDGLNKFELLVIDDLASERDTEYMGEIVQSIIDARYRSGKPLIVTTNLTAEELKHPADMRKQRIYSRLFEMCRPIEVTGVDRRKMKLKEGYKTVDSYLGLE